tara:strand:+ start:52 stop:510 length:459 start_codon:yes stop_codon:yes gene_type:complete
MACIIKRLPTDVVNKIIPYTYEVQSPELLADIRNYSNTMKVIRDIYRKEWLEDGDLCNCSGCFISTEDIDWLINDIFGYANNGFPTGIVYVDEFCDFWLRYKKMNTYNQVYTYMTTFERKPVVTQINMFWGIMRPEERILFVNRSLYQYDQT